MTETATGVWKHAVFYVWLPLAAAGPLIERASHGTPILLPLAVLAGIAAWYWIWQVTAAAKSRVARAVYLSGAAAGWLALVWLDSGFVLIGLLVFAPHCMENRGVGFAAVAGFAAGWLWFNWDASAGVPWSQILIAALFVAGGTATVQYVSWHARVSAERARLIGELRGAQAARESAERAAGVAEERRRLARDIHDTLTQGFASIALFLEAAEETLPDDAPARHPVTRALNAARENLEESRRVVWALRPAALDGSGLPEALKALGERVGEEHGIEVTTTVTGTVTDLPEDGQEAMLRAAQEALSNATKHARARRVDVTLSYVADAVLLDVRDDGCGFAVGPTSRGVGLAAMAERLDRIGGQLRVESAVGVGSTVAARIPVAP